MRLRPVVPNEIMGALAQTKDREILLCALERQFVVISYPHELLDMPLWMTLLPYGLTTENSCAMIFTN